ncbi:protein AKTIP homolog isoform X2 [Xenia sp. Carnegie-2017]|uniref:protein AKTIP homolog isoform X2 n=1 Tax=Xenia sp. Carnegie-2017 TaxID=2897299 RepID=UPI001F041F86|nr:protein AKTIP homolog isoform X2 [Xenia sp. Carnegie-2017]
MLKDMKYQIKRKLFLSDNNQPQPGKPTNTQDGEKEEVERKRLPSIPTPDLDEYMNRSVAKQKANVTSSEVLKSYGPYFMEYTLLAEYNLLQNQLIPGLYVLPAAKTPLIWYGVLFIHHGIYEDGVFKFIMTIPETFPDGECPLVKFVPPVYHPLINIESGEVDVKQAFPSWRTVNHLWQVLLFVRRLFYRIEISDAVNEEAAELYNNDNESYRKKVSENIRLCSEQLSENIDDDPHSIRFTEWDFSKHGNVKNSMINFVEKKSSTMSRNAQLSGLSWVEKGSVKIFSKHDET